MNLSRRSLLAAAGASSLLAGCGTAEEPVKRAARPRRIRYAEDHESQFADLRIPDKDPLATVVLLHGGYWLPQYGADQLDEMADRLSALGYATWNVEYRRTNAGGGYPTTFTDVAAAVDRLAGDGLPNGIIDNVVVLGHSAGGHLAVWAASRTERTPGGPPKVVPGSAVSLSGVLDLSVAALDPRSAAPVTGFMGGTPTEHPDRYALGDPALLVPASCPVWAAHADHDSVVPVEQSTGYVAKATAAGGKATHVPLPGDHLSIIDPSTKAFPIIRKMIPGSAPEPPAIPR